MKHIKGVKIAVLVAVFAAIGGGKPLLADSETVGGVTWTYTVSDGVATITDRPAPPESSTFQRRWEDTSSRTLQPGCS